MIPLSRFYAGLMILCILAFLLEIVGYATPGWMAFDLTNDTRVGSSLNMSLFYVISCPNVETRCIITTHSGLNNSLSLSGPVGYNSLVSNLIKNTDNDLHWLAWSILATLAIVLGFIGMVLAIFTYHMASAEKPFARKYAVAAGILLLFSGIASWVPVGMAFKAYMDIKQMYSGVDDSVKVNIPWSLLIFCCGTLISMFSIIIIIVTEYMSHSQYKEHWPKMASSTAGHSVVRIENAMVDVYLNKHEETIPQANTNHSHYSTSVWSGQESKRKDAKFQQRQPSRNVNEQYSPQDGGPSWINQELIQSSREYGRQNGETNSGYEKLDRISENASNQRNGVHKQKSSTNRNSYERKDRDRLSKSKDSMNQLDLVLGKKMRRSNGSTGSQSKSANRSDTNTIPKFDKSHEGGGTGVSNAELRRLHEEVDEIYSTRLPEYRMFRRKSS